MKWCGKLVFSKLTTRPVDLTGNQFISDGKVGTKLMMILEHLKKQTFAPARLMDEEHLRSFDLLYLHDTVRS